MMTDKNVESLIAEWQKRLGLLDWRIAYKIISLSDEHSEDYLLMKRNGWTASNTSSMSSKIATICLMKQTEWSSRSCKKYTASDEEYEEAIVHELTHISVLPLMMPYDNECHPLIELSLPNHIIEQVVTAISSALMRTKYGRDTWPITKKEGYTEVGAYVE